METNIITTIAVFTNLILMILAFIESESTDNSDKNKLYNNFVFLLLLFSTILLITVNILF